MIVSQLVELWRRRELALDLLAEYDRDREPVDLEQSMRLLEQYVGSGHWQTERRSIAVDTWRQAAEAKAEDYRGGAA